MMRNCFSAAKPSPCCQQKGGEELGVCRDGVGGRQGSRHCFCLGAEPTPASEGPLSPRAATRVTEPAVAMETKDFLKTPAKRRRRPKKAEGKCLLWHSTRGCTSCSLHTEPVLPCGGDFCALQTLFSACAGSSLQGASLIQQSHLFLQSPRVV